VSVLELVWQRPAPYDRQEAALFGAERFGACEASTKAGKTTGTMCWLAGFRRSRPRCRLPVGVSEPRPVEHGSPPVAADAPQGRGRSDHDTEATVRLANGATIWHRSGDWPETKPCPRRHPREN
jgi:hypothetical protein